MAPTDDNILHFHGLEAPWDPVNTTKIYDISVFNAFLQGSVSSDILYSQVSLLTKHHLVVGVVFSRLWTPALLIQSMPIKGIGDNEANIT